MSAAGYEPGSVFRSFTEGVDATQRWRRNRQNEEANDIILRSAKDAEGAHRLDMEETGSIPSEWGLKNPWIDKFLNFAKGLGPGKMTRPPRGSVSVSDVADEPSAYETADYGLTPGQAAGPSAYETADYSLFADGGRPRSALRGYADGEMIDDEEVKKRAAENRARKPGSVENATETVKKPIKGAQSNPVGGNVSTQGEGRVGGPTRKHMARRALDRGASSTAGKAGVAGALGATALTVAGTPTEQYRERFGMELGPGEDATFMGDLGVRTLGAASDLGNVMTFGLAGRGYRDLQRGSAAPAATATPAPATPAATPAAAGGPASGGSMSAGGRRAISPDAQPADMMDVSKIQMSDVGPESIPDFRTRDWSDFREKALQGLVARGMPLAQAAEEVDTQTMRMQQKGFNHFAMQGAALLRAGNTKGAMAAIKAAYQMFPSGDDVNLGVHNGQVFGITIDEETGKPTGQPIAITPESILGLVDQANKPGAWNEYAKDQRDFQFTVKKYMEVDRPLAGAQGSALLTNASANMLNANSNANESAAKADYYRMGGSGGGGGGGGGADFRNSERVYRDRLEMLAMNNPQAADEIGAQMSELKRRNPGVPDNVIIKYAMDRAGYGGEE